MRELESLEGYQRRQAALHTGSYLKLNVPSCLESHAPELRIGSACTAPRSQESREQGPPQSTLLPRQRRLKSTRTKPGFPHDKDFCLGSQMFVDNDVLSVKNPRSTLKGDFSNHRKLRGS